MTVPLPTVETPITKFGMPWAVNGVVRRNTVFQRSKRDRHLERRARRVLTGDRLIGQRVIRILDKILPFLGTNAFAESVRIV